MFDLPELPYQTGDLEPHISQETLEEHHGKHLAKYIEALNGLTQGTLFEDLSLVQLMHKTKGALYNNAAQAWNHQFYFRCMSPEGTADPSPAIARELERAFGSVEEFKKQFSTAALEMFGSGWIWLVQKPEGLCLVVGGNAGNPLTDDSGPVLGLDVWEHAYYLDYKSDREAYIDSWWNVIDWEFVEEMLLAG